MDRDFSNSPCAECGVIMDEHALVMRGDGVVTAGVIKDGDDDWTMCAEVRRQRDDARIAELKRELKRLEGLRRVY